MARGAHIAGAGLTNGPRPAWKRVGRRRFFMLAKREREIVDHITDNIMLTVEQGSPHAEA